MAFLASHIVEALPPDPVYRGSAFKQVFFLKIWTWYALYGGVCVILARNGAYLSACKDINFLFKADHTAWSLSDVMIACCFKN